MVAQGAEECLASVPPGHYSSWLCGTPNPMLALSVGEKHSHNQGAHYDTVVLGMTHMAQVP